MKTANKNQFLIVAKATDKKIHSFQLSFALQPLAVSTLETDAGYPLDNSRQVIRLNLKLNGLNFGWTIRLTSSICFSTSQTDHLSLV